MQSTLYAQVISFYQADDYRGVIQAFTDAIELDAEDQWSYCFRGFAYYALANYELAIEDYNKAIELGLKNVAIYYKRALCHGRLGNIREATRDCDKAIELDRDYGAAYRLRAIVCDFGQTETTSEDSNRAAKLKLQRRATESAQLTVLAPKGLP